MLVINDLHLGVQRSGGTTPQSQFNLRYSLRESVRRLIDNEMGEVTVNGDLFDGFTVDVVEVVSVYEIFADWLQDVGARDLNLVQGNHDWNPRGDKLSSFHLLGHFLQARFGKRVRIFDKGYAHVSNNVCCIPHMPNQELFNMEVTKAIAEGGDGCFLLLHCNYKNGFAENSDHSLNLGDDQVGSLIKAGWNLVLGHEHQGYELRGGKVKVVGNQFPSSVADCLGNFQKKALRINGEKSSYVETWESRRSFAMVDWQEDNVPVAQFIRFTGEATAAQAADVISRISKFRQNCGDDIFVVTNAVKIEGCAAAEEMAADSIENIKAFDVMGAIFENLEPKEIEVVKELIGE
jgi:hypothetical protein